MNQFFDKVEEVFFDEVSYKRFVFNSPIKNSIEKAINRMFQKREITKKNERLIIYFFKTSSATDQLLTLMHSGFEMEARKLIGTNYSILRKKKSLNALINVLHRIISGINKCGPLDSDSNARYKKLSEKIFAGNIENLSSEVQARIASQKFNESVTIAVDAGEMLVEDDFVSKWGKVYHEKTTTPLASSFKIEMSDQEIRFFYIYSLQKSLETLIQVFAEQFNQELAFSFENVKNNEPVRIIEPRPTINDEKIKRIVFEIIKKHIHPRSQKNLEEFLNGKVVTQKIEFLGLKQELLSIFLLLYRNKFISKPKQLGQYIAQSFIAPNSPSGAEFSAESSREFLIRTKENDSFPVLHEIQGLVKKLQLHW